MAKEHPLGRETYLMRRAVEGIMSPRVLAWQLAGVAVAALGLALTNWLGSASEIGVVAFVFGAVGFLFAYVVLAVTGCIVGRVIRASAEGAGEEAEGVGPLHFLLDNLASATVVPLVFSGGVAMLAAILCVPVALWQGPVIQAILVLPSPVLFAFVFAMTVFLFVLLFTAPVIVVMEQPEHRDVAESVFRMLRERPLVVLRVFGVGLVGAALAAMPAAILIEGARVAVVWLSRTANASAATPFADFVLTVYKGVLYWAPIFAVPFAFLNALALHAYEDLFAEAGADEEAAGGAAGGGEEIDLKTESPPASEPDRWRRADSSDE